MTLIAVVGGGISGLAAAHHAREIASAESLEAKVTVFERSPRVGGCIETRRDDGFVLELGSDSLATEKVAATQLAARLGLELQPIDEAFRGTCVVRDGRLVRMPDEFRLFAPTSLRALMTSGLFTPGGMLRAALEPLVPPRKDTADESLASFVTRRFGREVLDRLAQPLLGGIYSGDPAKLSLQATMPQLAQIEQKYGSLVRGMRALTKSAPSGPRLVSIRGGLGALTDALVARLHADIRTNVAVTELRRSGKGWDLSLSDGTHVAADAVICALPAYAAAELLHPLEPELARKLAAIEYHSIATVTTVFDAREVPELPVSTGFVVPAIERRPMMAATFSSRKYAGRTLPGFEVLRAFIGGGAAESLVSADDETLTRIVANEFREILGLEALPKFVVVRRWLRAMPEYAVGHRARIDDIERLADSLANFALAGSAYRGVGIADCIRGGEAAAIQTVSSVPSSAIAHGP
jgi:oxygen-dependent protoporphyrinogen oxidase